MKKEMSFSTILSFLLGVIVGYGCTTISKYKQNVKKFSGHSKKSSKWEIANHGNCMSKIPLKDIASQTHGYEGIDPRALQNQLSNFWLVAYGDKPMLISAKKSFQYISDFFKHNGSDEQKQWWTTFCTGIESWDLPKFVEMSQKLLDYVEDNGVNHGNIGDIVWDENSGNTFICYNDVNIGQKCKIIAPIFLYKGEVLKKGVVKPI